MSETEQNQKQEMDENTENSQTETATEDEVKQKLRLFVLDEVMVHNLQILENLKEDQKLFLSDDQKLYVDERWVQPIRRRVDGSNRYDVLLPFFNCYLQSLVRYSELTNDEMNLLEKSLKGLEILKNTYDDFGELKLFYNDINNTLENIKKTKVDKKEIGVNCDIIKRRCKKPRRWCEDV